jgi:AraC family transcriptional regulator
MQPFAAVRVVSYGANSSMATHVHDVPSLCAPLVGCYEETIRGRSEAQKPGALLYCPPGEPHAQRFGSRRTVKLLLMPSRDSIGYLDAHLRLAEAPRIRTTDVTRLGRRIAAELKIDDSFAPVAIEGLSLELLAIFARQGQNSGEAAPHWLRSACDYLKAHLARPVTLAELGRAVNRHPAQLSRAFRNAFGQSVGEWQRAVRIDRACALLHDSRAPLADVALTCGYYDQAHFTRAFRAHTGQTPAAYRRAC